MARSRIPWSMQVAYARQKLVDEQATKARIAALDDEALLRAHRKHVMVAPRNPVAAVVLPWIYAEIEVRWPKAQVQA